MNPIDEANTIDEMNPIDEANTIDEMNPIDEAKYEAANVISRT